MSRVVETGHEDPGALTVLQVAAGEAHTLALTVSGSVYTWGRGQFGRQGIGVFQDELFPTHVEIGLDLEDEDASHPDSHSTREDSRPGFSKDRDMPPPCKISQVAAGAYHSLALAGDGTVWSWGFNAYGQLGRQNAASYPAPITFPRSRSYSFDDGRTSGSLWNQGAREINGRHSKVVLVEAGGMMSSAIDQEGGLWLWGAVPHPSAELQTSESNFHNEGTLSLSNIEKPERVLALRGHRVHRVACGTEHILALVEGRNTVDCYAWGSNSFGQLGLGDFEPRSIPTKMTSLIVQQVGIVVDLACGAFHSAIITVKDDDLPDLGFETRPGSPMQKKMQPSPQLLSQVLASPKLRGRSTSEQYIETKASPRLRSRQGDRYVGYHHSVANNGSGSYSGFSSYSESSSRAYSQISTTSWGGIGSRTHSKKESYGGDGRLSTCWMFGQNENGQLGQGHCTDSETPTPVEGLPTSERLQTVVCGPSHTAVVMESGDVWVWGMEGGLGQCPGIGPPDARSGDALTPVQVFGESSAKCNIVTGSKGIACGAAHTLTISNGGNGVWAWGRGKNGVLGLGHASDSWYPSPVLWPPEIQPAGPRDSDTDAMYHMRKSTRTSSRSGSRGRGDEIRPYIPEMESNRPPRSSSLSRKPKEQYSREVEDSRHPRSPWPPKKAVQSPQPSRRGDHFWPQHEYEEPRKSIRETGTEIPSTSLSFKYQNGQLESEHSGALEVGLAECRRYAKKLHAAVYGGLETFSNQLLGDSMCFDSRSNPEASTEVSSDDLGAKSLALQEWQRHIEEAPIDELVKLELFYKGMRNRLKDILFQRKMEDWCRRCMSTLSSSSFQEPPPVRESYSVPSTPLFGGPIELALRMSSVLADRGEMLPPAALAASLAEFRTQSQRRR